MHERRIVWVRKRLSMFCNLLRQGKTKSFSVVNAVQPVLGLSSGFNLKVHSVLNHKVAEDMLDVTETKHHLFFAW